MRRGSVYVHFPYCLAKCPYCDFVSYATPRDAIDHQGYADAVIRELAARTAAWPEELSIGSVFFGGGTPSLWEPSALGRVLLAIKGSFECDADLEVTVECNPSSLDRERAVRLREQGVGRLSIGVQALDDAQLVFLGRLHDAEGGLTAVRDALASSMPRVSADLIFGLPEQAPDDAEAQAGRLADLGLSHLSCYQLTIEPGTPFGALARKGRLPLADDGRVAECFVAVEQALGKRGLAHYEISNYARPGEEARHNLGYWSGQEYVGVGTAACGFARSEGKTARGVRYKNTADPARYVDATRQMGACIGEGDGVAATSEDLDGETLMRERIMLGLRLASGFDIARSATDLGVEAWPEERSLAARRLSAQGRLAVDGDVLRIPMESWLWADDTAARLF